MSYQNIAELLEKLRKELEKGDIDESSRQLLSQFDAELNVALSGDEASTDASGEPVTNETLTDTAKRLETHFAAEHPVAETALREIINALARMGI